MSTPPGPGFAPPAGQGTIQQWSGGRNILRKRTIQHQSSLTLKYKGGNWLDPNATPLAQNNRRYLAGLARYWRVNLITPDRIAWAFVAPPGMTGFQTYMAVNKVTQRLSWVQPFLVSWNGIPYFPLATGMANFTPTNIVATTYAPGSIPPWPGYPYPTVQPWDALQLNCESDGSWDLLALSFVVTKGVPSAKKNGSRYLLEAIPPVIYQMYSTAWIIGYTVFGLIPTGTPMHCFIRPYNSSTGIIGRKSFKVIFPPA